MSLQWLEMRIEEEQERRRKEQQILERLPAAMEEVQRELTSCVEAYTKAFGAQSAAIERHGSQLRVTAGDQHVEVTPVPVVPGLRIERPGHEPVSIDVGVLPGEKLFYRLEDRYLSLEEVSRQILDRVLFPKLPE